MKGKKSKLHLAVAAAILAGVCGFTPSVQATPDATALPVGGITTSAIITKTDTKTLDIKGSANNLITWQSFSVGKDATVNFDTNNYLNYVRGNNLSEIYGKITGEGAIYIVNPNGITIGDGAQVNVGSLHLSTAEISKTLLTDYDTALNALGSVTTFVGDIVNKGTLDATKEITVKGNNITFKNIDDVKVNNEKNSSSVKITANTDGKIHIGYGLVKTGDTLTSETMTSVNYSTSNDPILYKLVNTPGQLQSMNTDLNGKYMLAKDLDMNGVNFTPIGGSFAGRFDGLGYTLSNLNINVVSNQWHGNFTGLFGTVAKNGVVENIGIKSGSITTDTWVVGSIAGSNAGTVRNVYNNANVAGSTGDNCDDVGGIVGLNSGTVENAYNTGAVTQNGYLQVGGVVGWNNGGTVKNSYNSGTVTWVGKSGSDYQTKRSAGGIVGENVGTVLNCYNTGEVKVTNASYNGQVGGIVGYADNKSKIQNTYNVGTVSGRSDNIGGIVGSNVGTVTASYYESVADGTYTNTTGTSKTETELKTLNTFSAWTTAIDSTGESRTAAWRIYENTTTPLLTAFMTRQDEESVTVYNGSKDVDYYGDEASTNTSKQLNDDGINWGINWVNSVAVVTNAPLTLSGNVTKVYDGTTTATFATDNLNGLVASDKSKVTINATANYDGKNVGTGKAVTYSDLALSGDKGKNYAIIDNGKLTTGEITQAPLTLTVNDYSKEYDGTTSAVGKGYSQSGTIFDGDSLSGTAVYAFTDKNAGTNKTLNLTGLTINDGNNGKNYNFIIVPSTNSAITQAPLTITAGEATKTYDGTPTVTNANYVYTGLVQGETIYGVTLTYDNKNAGTGNKTLTPSEAKILDADNNDSTANYKISYVANNTSTINKAPLTLTVVDFSKEYDGTTDAPGATYQLSIDKLYDGDSLSGTLVFDSAAVGTGKTLGFTEYTIGDGVNNNNYEVTYIPSTNSSITLNTPNAKVTLVEDQLEEAGSSMQQLQEATAVAATPETETKAEELDTAATTQTTSGDSAGNNTNETVNTPTANDNTNTSMEWNGIGTVTMENNGINPPKSMSAEEVARQERGEE